MKLNYKVILSELDHALKTSDFIELPNFVEKISSASNIVVFGAGRVGLMMKTFSMRLNHLGLNSYFLGEINLPATGKGDLLIIGSGSGNTQSVVTIAEIAHSKGLDVICVSSNIDSKIANLSSSIIHLNCQTKESVNQPRLSIQPMTTIFEQSILIFLDALVLKLMETLGEDNESMLKRHNVIE
jgi:6-phospho-3-hexuloisomerase